MRFEVGSAYAMGIGLPLLEALRRKTNFDNFHSYIDDFIAGGLLLYAAHAVATEKRGGDWKRSTLHDTLAGPEGEQQLDLLELDTALEELATLNPRHLRDRGRLPGRRRPEIVRCRSGTSRGLSRSLRCRGARCRYAALASSRGCGPRRACPAQPPRRHRIARRARAHLQWDFVLCRG